MDTARYRAFLTAVDTGSFTRAAEVLNYSTSGVSQLIQSLEQDLGLPLLTRSRRGVTPTPAGESLLPAIRAVVQQEDRVLQTASELNGLMTGEVRIATYSSISSHWLPRVIKAFRRDYPNVQIHLMEGIRKEVLQWLSESRADIAFLSQVKGTPYDWIPLAEDPMIAILPPGASFFSPLRTKSCCPSEIFGSPGANLPSSPFLFSASTAFCSRFQSIPNGGFEMQYWKV